MVSTTSGTATFHLDVDDLIEESLEALGGDYTGAVEQSKARRTLNLLLIELQNKNIPLHKILEQSVTVVATTNVYVLDADVNDVLEVTLHNTTSDFEIPLTRVGVKEYHNLTAKAQTGQPTTYVTDRKTDAINLTVWPIPDTSASWTLDLLSIKRIEDVTAAYQRIDLPHRYAPLLVTWLSYKLCMHRQGIPEEIKNRIKAELDVIMLDTFEEDRERVDFIITPGGISGR